MAALKRNPEQHVHGYVEKGFEEVKAVFIENFHHGPEIGASVCVYYKGRKVVDLWGGYRDKRKSTPWQQNTMAVIFSTTKGVCALAMNLAYSRGYFDYDDKVSKHWPEFAANGKQDITIRQLLNHEAGLVLTPDPIPMASYANPDSIARILADVKPYWTPGEKHGYHLGTFGLYLNEIIRRTDPKHRTISRFISDEISKPLDAEFYIGLPADIPDTIIATMDIIQPAKAIEKSLRIPWAVSKKMMQGGSLLGRAMRNMADFDPNNRETWQVEFPSVNGISNARNLARIYSEFATGGKTIGLKPEALKLLMEPASSPLNGKEDVVLGVRGWYSLGFLKPGAKLLYGVDQTPFGWPGAGGSFAFADPVRQLSYAYVMNYMDVYLPLDPRDARLHTAVYKCISALSK